MNGLEGMGRALIAAGVLLVALGALMAWGGQWLGLGRLPGDIVVRRGNFTFYFPIMTMLAISILLTLIWRLLRR